jgi:hypothetical protein
MGSVRLWLPESYRQREEEVRARGAVAIVTGPDVGLPPMTDEKVRDVAAGLAIESALPLLAALALVMGSVPHRDHAELRAEQVRAARAILPPPYRQRAIDYLEAGRRDLVFSHEQLLVAMRLVIEHGQPGPPGQVDQPRLAQLLLGLTDVMVSGEEFKARAKGRYLDVSVIPTRV